jgi:hypothetical protein
MARPRAALSYSHIWLNGLFIRAAMHAQQIPLSDDNPEMRSERPLNQNRILMHTQLIPDDDAEMRLERLDLDIETIADGIQSTQDEIEFRESKIAAAARRVPRAGERRVSAVVDALAGVHSDGECVVRRVRAVRDGVGDMGAHERVSE